MKKAICRIAGMLALASLAITQAARAQEPVLANIPFDFTVGKMTLPAGEYRTQKVRDSSPALLIQRTDRSAAMIVMAQAATSNAPQPKTKLVFHRYGNQYFLAQIWVAGSSRGLELPKSAKEKEHSLARNEAPDQVTIVAQLISPKL